MKGTPDEKHECNVCGKIFRWPCQVESHRNKVHQCKYFKLECDICGKQFESNNSLDIHIDKTHLSRKLMCEICGKEYESKYALNEHTKKEHGMEKIVCDCCYRAFSNEQDLEFHKQKLHPSIKCEFCNESFQKGSEKLRSHIQLLHKETKCEVCGKYLGAPKALKRHKQSYHSGVQWKCDICGKNLSCKDTLNEHKKWHFGKSRSITSKNFKCDQCDKTFVRPSALKIHVADVHSDRILKCALCDANYKAYASLKRHEKEVHFHDGTMYSCDVCGKTFNTKPKLKQHTNIVHSKEGLIYKCEVCEKHFNNKGTLKHHHNNVHKEPCHYDCDICGITLGSRMKYHGHMRNHKTSSNFCTHCGKATITPSYKHSCEFSNIHKCDKCAAGFSTNSDLQIHLLGNKCHNCTICGRLFKWRSTLRRHKKNCK